MKVEPPLIIYEKPGQYTEEIYKNLWMETRGGLNGREIIFMCNDLSAIWRTLHSGLLETLKAVDLIAAEDTRHSIKLLNHFDIKTKMTS